MPAAPAVPESRHRPAAPAVPKIVRTRLGRLMRERGLTLGELAERSGISRQSLSLWKRGAVARYSPEVLGALIEALDCELTDLLEVVEVDADDL